MSASERTQASFAPISVVIPLYNCAAYIGRALDSIWRQTIQPSEIIVIDDGSTDDGPDVVNAISDPRLRMIHQPNSGVSAARNAGIAAATAPIVAFLDADDWWMPEFLETITRLRERHPECEVFGTSYVFQTGAGADRPAIMRRCHVERDDGILGDYFDTASRSDPPLFTSAVAATRRALDEVGGFPTGIGQGEDLLTWARLAARFQIAYSLRPQVVYWTPAFDAALPTRRPESPDRVGAHLRDLLQSVPPRQRKSLRNYIGLWHRMRGTMFLRLGDRVSARAEFDRSLGCSALNARSLMYAVAARSPASLVPATLATVRGLRQITRRPRLRLAKNASDSA